MLTRITLTLLLLLTTTLSYAQSQPSSQKWEQYRATSTATSRIVQADVYLIQLKVDTKQQLLLQHQFSVLRQLDANWFIVSHKKGMTTLPDFCLQAFSANHQWKRSPKLTAQQSLSSILLIKVSDIETFTAAMKEAQLDFTIKTIHHATQSLIIQPSNSITIDQLIALKSVRFVDRYYDDLPKTESRVLGMDLTANQVTTLQNKQPTLDGTGMLVSVNEQLFDEEDLDLIGRTIFSDVASDNQSNHATEMATIIAGAGNSSRNGLGIAHAGQLSSSNNATRLPNENSYYQSQNISTQNHSWGDGVETFYGSIAEAYDKNANDNPELLHVFSVGNSGTLISEAGNYQGIPNYANITGEYKMAKNMLVVGAVDWTYQSIANISKGPAHDGRVKPELCAYSIGGSSGAAATVSGISTLLQQAYKEQHSGNLPASALLKAVLINSATDAGAAGLDFETGYGNVNAWKAHQSLINEHYFEGTVGQDDNQSFQITLPANASNLKVTIVWNDPAATPNANLALVNDLDLVVTDPTTNSFLPWVLNSSAHADSLPLPAVRKADHLNNIEQVSIESPVAGTYQINVNGFDVASGSQRFYIVYEWQTADVFEWLYPLGGDNLPYLGEGTSFNSNAGYFRWESTFSTGEMGLLEYSLDNGLTWDIIETASDLANDQQIWDIPTNISGLAIARMTIDGVSHISEQFVISRSFLADVGFNCDDSVMLTWPPTENASTYRVYKMGDQYLEPIITTTDTFTILSTIDYPEITYSIEPVYATGQSAIRSPAFDYTQQGVNCYLISFFPIGAENGAGIDLFLSLGTTYAISDIVFEQLVDGEYVEISTITDLSQTMFQVTHLPSLSGLQTYRARINFENGGELLTDPASIYFLSDEVPVLVFPNPIAKGDELNVFTKDLNGQPANFRLYSSAGHIILDTDLFSDRSVFLAESITPGVYIYHLTVDGETSIGRLVIL